MSWGISRGHDRKNGSIRLERGVFLSIPLAVGIAGVVALFFALMLLSRPRKSAEMWWKFQQTNQPYWKVPKPPVGMMIAVGVLLLIVAAGAFQTAWTVLNR